ncbi:hypothetical protein Nepgr_007990 [Nepenthes gracilis]|uniref:Uncharacterized protein n=1 Tax=Nepenthes gracilis TaxID=150966 RepID=A0AAD3XIZ2_NEPGR|nr:hypothetical protein Nepgr_007990 [Nepenthes gracilis]
MEGNVDQLSQFGQALPGDAGAEVDTSKYETYVDGLAPGVPTGSLKEGTSEEISSVAFISLSRVEGSSDLPELIADRDLDQSPFAEGSVLDVFDSVDSFAILQDPEDLDVQELQCGPPVELSCKAPVSIPGATPGNKPVELTSKAEMHADLEPGDDVHVSLSTDDLW